jgi:ABC-type nitrate/sulfonate/bicarbonate transport system substrate-binding protein
VKLERLRWGVPSFWIERLPVYYGRYRGFFRDRGIDLEIRYLWGGPHLAAALAEGRVLIGEIGMPPFLKAFAEGLPARVIGSSTIQKLDHYLACRPDVRDMRDLRGRRVGILSFGSCDDYFARHMLRVAGLDPEKDVSLVPLRQAYGDVRCFARRPPAGLPRVDAGFLVDPFLAQGESLGLVRVLAVVRDYFPRYQWGLVLARDSLLVERPELAERAMDAFRDSCRAIAANPESAAAFGAQVFHLPKEVFRRALLRDLAHWELDARLDPAGMENCLRVQQEMGAVPATLTTRGMVRQL